MKAAIIGLPRSGKSTLFQAVTGREVDPYAPPVAKQAVVHVPDPRLEVLSNLFKSKKIVEATIEFEDIPGCSLDDAKGQAEWRGVLPLVRQADLLVVVIRDFENASVPAYRDRVDASQDLTIVWDEIIFADLDAVTKRVEKLHAQLKKPTKTHDQEQRELALLERCSQALESGAPLSTVLNNDEERQQVASFAFLTEKPLLCVRNVSDDRAAGEECLASDHLAASVALSASIESEIAILEPEDRSMFLEDLGLKEPARDRLIRLCYSSCGLISFLTTVADESLAWTISKGTTAVGAAAKIHTDLSRGFIRAETVAYDDLIAHEDMKGAKAAGKVRKEGKGYVVADGDVLNILSGV